MQSWECVDANWYSAPQIKIKNSQNKNCLQLHVDEILQNAFIQICNLLEAQLLTITVLNELIQKYKIKQVTFTIHDMQISQHLATTIHSHWLTDKWPPGVRLPVSQVQVALTICLEVTAGGQSWVWYWSVMNNIMVILVRIQSVEAMTYLDIVFKRKLC